MRRHFPRDASMVSRERGLLFQRWQRLGIPFIAANVKGPWSFMGSLEPCTNPQCRGCLCLLTAHDVEFPSLIFGHLPFKFIRVS